MLEMIVEGFCPLEKCTECDLSIRGRHIVTVSPPPEFEEKKDTANRRVFAMALAS